MRNWLDIIRGKTIFEGNVVPQDYRKDLLEMLPKNSICAELGVKIGDFSREIMDITEPKEIRLVDIWEKPNTFHTFLGNIIPYIKMDKTNIKFLRSDTHFAYASGFLPLKYFDWVYVDANHSYRSVIEDLTISYDITKDGGYIAGDDYDTKEYPEVVKAVNYFIDEYNHIIKPILLGKNRQFLLEKI